MGPHPSLGGNSTKNSDAGLLLTNFCGRLRRLDSFVTRIRLRSRRSISASALLAPSAPRALRRTRTKRARGAPSGTSARTPPRWSCPALGAPSAARGALGLSNTARRVQEVTGARRPPPAGPIARAVEAITAPRVLRRSGRSRAATARTARSAAAPTSLCAPTVLRGCSVLRGASRVRSVLRGASASKEPMFLCRARVAPSVLCRTCETPPSAHLAPLGVSATYLGSQHPRATASRATTVLQGPKPAHPASGHAVRVATARRARTFRWRALPEPSTTSSTQSHQRLVLCAHQASSAKASAMMSRTESAMVASSAREATPHLRLRIKLAESATFAPLALSPSSLASPGHSRPLLAAAPVSLARSALRALGTESLSQSHARRDTTARTVLRRPFRVRPVPTASALTWEARKSGQCPNPLNLLLARCARKLSLTCMKLLL